MNEVTLKGVIRDICYSHTINDIDYEQANIITKRENGKEDILSLKFKSYNNIYKDGDNVELVGNLRSYSQKVSDNKNKVSLYVFTYFDTPTTNEYYLDIDNQVVIDGRICKMDELRKTSNGKTNIHFILANNIISADGTQKLNNYIPSVAWGKIAYQCNELHISDKVEIIGQLHSRTYKKIDENGELQIKTAHELLVNEIYKLDD